MVHSTALFFFRSRFLETDQVSIARPDKKDQVSAVRVRCIETFALLCRLVVNAILFNQGI